MTYPCHWRDCPPIDAVDANGVVFRVVKSSPPTDTDFLTYEEMGKGYGPPCKRRGLSIFVDFAAAQHCIDLFGQFGNIIAKGNLTPKHGRIKKTQTTPQPDHYTWWPYVGVQRSGLFECVTDND